MQAGLHVLMHLSQSLPTPFPCYNATNQVFWFSGIERGSVRLSAETLAMLVEYFVVLFSLSWSTARKSRNTPTSVSFNFFQSTIRVFIHYSRIKCYSSPVTENAVKQSPEKLRNGQQKDSRER